MSVGDLGAPCRSRSCATVVIRTPAMPHGTIRSKYDRSVVTFSANPCHVTHWRAWTPMEASLRPAVQTPVCPALRSPTIANGARARMSAPSSCRRYQCRSRVWRCRSMIGYPTSWPGPWNVMSPPRSTSKSSTPRAANSSGVARSVRGSRAERPSVTTGGCSTNTSRSWGISPEMRRCASARCSSHTSAYGRVHSETTQSSRGCSIPEI